MERTRALVAGDGAIDQVAPAVVAPLDFCRPRLAGYKKPVEIRFVSELPRNSTGKLLRRALREQSR